MSKAINKLRMLSFIYNTNETTKYGHIDEKDLSDIRYHMQKFHPGPYTIELNKSTSNLEIKFENEQDELLFYLTEKNHA